ncbi:MAG: hypothetical protein LBM75_00340 [Myxococcales bacterium]|jgi:hypothetical protein|nr:hypothetical protein [Myxococcales bacterium]
MQLKKILFLSFLSTSLAFSMAACGGDDDENNTDSNNDGCPAIANFKYDTVVIQKSNKTQVDVSLNGLPVKKMKGAIKKDGTNWDIVERCGVSFDEIFKKAQLSEDDSFPVNLIGGDGFDALRTKIQDTAKLPKVDFMRAHAYIYADDPGNKHPAYPEIGTDGLIVDYDLESDADVPEYIGTGIAALSMMRMKVMEKVDATTDFDDPDLGLYYGLIEINPDDETN